MSAYYFDVKDIKTAKEKHGDELWFRIDTANIGSSRDKLKPTYYLPIQAMNAAGRWITPALRFNRQLLASNAKLGEQVKEENAKDLRVVFKKLTATDLENTDYAEEKRAGLLDSNAEFIEALDIIADQFDKLIKDVILKYRGKDYKVVKSLEQPVPKIFNFKQTRRRANADEIKTDDDSDEVPSNFIELPTPLYRIRIAADPNTQKLGYYDKKQDKHVYTVFDMEKTNLEAKMQGDVTKAKPVVAKLKMKSKNSKKSGSPYEYVDLTISNAKNFITYMSLTAGIILFDRVCISNVGISIQCKFKQLHVIHHKTMKTEAINDELYGDMLEYGRKTKNTEEEVFEDLDEPIENNSEEEDEPSVKNRNSKKPVIKKSLTATLEEDDDIPVSQPKKSKNQATTKKKSGAQPKLQVTEDESDDSNEITEEPIDEDPVVEEPVGKKSQKSKKDSKSNAKKTVEEEPDAEEEPAAEEPDAEEEPVAEDNTEDNAVEEPDAEEEPVAEDNTEEPDAEEEPVVEEEPVEITKPPKSGTAPTTSKASSNKPASAKVMPAAAKGGSLKASARKKEEL